ncbi:MAG: PD-(D/E)XK nuclease family protein, partial [Arenimonas sp.]
VISGQKRELPTFKQSVDFLAITLASPSQHLQADWRVLSFSQLTHATRHQGPVVSAAADEAESAASLASMGEDVFDKRFAGIAFGNALHHVLENTAVEVWRDQDDINTTPTLELPLLQQALLRQGYRQEELAAGIAQLSPLIFNTLKARLPETVRLCDLPEHARLNEMEFHFSLRACDSQSLLALLKQHGILQQREDFQTLRRLNGLMTGKVDLIYQHQNRFYICDYKSNRLPAYDAETCQQAMRDSEYDFQALIYTLALHRWCKFRLQAHYDYETHIGGIRYLFCRGLQAQSQHDTGIVAMRFDRDLIDQLEHLLRPSLEAAV